MRRAGVTFPAALALVALAVAAAPGRAGEGDEREGGRPAGRDLFGTRGKPNASGTADRKDAPARATVVWSDGTKETGTLSFTAGVPLTVYDLEGKEWVDVELADLARLAATPREENLDREWRWKEYGSDEKVYTGRARPRRWLDHEVELQSGGRMKVHVKGTVAYLDVAPPAPDGNSDGEKGDAGKGGAGKGGSQAAKAPAKPDAKPDAELTPVRRRLVIRQYERGEWGDTLEGLVYVKSIAVGGGAPGGARGAGGAEAKPRAKPPAKPPGAE